MCPPHIPPLSSILIDSAPNICLKSVHSSPPLLPKPGLLSLTSDSSSQSSYACLGDLSTTWILSVTSPISKPFRSFPSCFGQNSNSLYPQDPPCLSPASSPSPFPPFTSTLASGPLKSLSAFVQAVSCHRSTMSGPLCQVFTLWLTSFPSKCLSDD